MPRCGDNDGLYTAEYIASQAFRFAVTQVCINVTIGKNTLTHLIAELTVSSLSTLISLFSLPLSLCLYLHLFLSPPSPHPRYPRATFKNTSIQPEVWTHVEALARLHSVTGIPGFFARTYFKEHEWVDCNTAGGRWYNSTTLKGYIWKGDGLWIIAGRASMSCQPIT